MTTHTRDRYRSRQVRVVLAVLLGVVAAGLLGVVLSGVGTASASQLGVTAKDGVASGTAVPTACSTAQVATMPQFVGGNPEKHLTGVSVTGIPGSCVGATVLVSGHGTGGTVLFHGSAVHDGSGTVLVSGFDVAPTTVLSMHVTIL